MSFSTLVSNFIKAEQWVASCEGRYNEALTTLTRAQNELAAATLPKDAKVGESFSVWTRINEKQEKLLTVKLLEDGFEVSWRL